MLSGIFDLEGECLKIISLVHGEGLKAFLKSWIGLFSVVNLKREVRPSWG